MSNDASEPLRPQEEEFLRALARTLAFVPRVFEADLGRAEGLSSSEFFALMHLSEATGGRLRMGDLAAVTALTPGRTTQVVARLEDQGLVERRPCATDRRGQDAVLTAEGRRRLDAVRPRQVASVRRRIFDKLDGLDLPQVTEALVRLSTDDEPRTRGER